MKEEDMKKFNGFIVMLAMGVILGFVMAILIYNRIIIKLHLEIEDLKMQINQTPTNATHIIKTSISAQITEYYYYKNYTKKVNMILNGGINKYINGSSGFFSIEDGNGILIDAYPINITANRTYNFTGFYLTVPYHGNLSALGAVTGRLNVGNGTESYIAVCPDLDKYHSWPYSCKPIT